MNDKIIKTDGGGQKIGYVDSFLEKLPEIHINGYNYCGPNTNLEIHSACVNELDCACKEHDIAYTESNDLESRYKSDKVLFSKSNKRIFAKDSRFGERIAALITAVFIGIKMILVKIEIYINRVRMYFKMKSTANE